MKKMDKFCSCFNMKGRHEYNFGIAFSVGKDYFYLGFSIWFLVWDIHVSISGTPKE